MWRGSYDWTSVHGWSGGQVPTAGRDILVPDQGDGCRDRIFATGVRNLLKRAPPELASRDQQCPCPAALAQILLYARAKPAGG